MITRRQFSEVPTINVEKMHGFSDKTITLVGRLCYNIIIKKSEGESVMEVLKNMNEVNPKMLEDDIEVEIMKANHLGFDYEIETEEETEEEPEEQPFQAEKIRVDQQMLSVKYMLELMEDGLIELNPGYQRHRVWKDNKRKSLLIESLMLRIPIPAFYFYENEDGKYQVIDGQQRLATIQEFVQGKFQLSGLEYLGKEYNWKGFQDLEIKYVQRIYRTQIAVNILDARSPKKVIYDIFRRVNTGGINLKPQEMRNAICKPEVREFLRKSISNENYLLATRAKVKDDRMDAQELALRFYAFGSAYDYEKEFLHYDYSNIATMLDGAIEALNKTDAGVKDALYARFDEAMRRCYCAFGEYCFSKILWEGERVRRRLDYINKSLFVSFSVLLLHPKYDNIDLEKYQKRIVEHLAIQLTEDYMYLNSLTIGTGNRRNVYLNFERSRRVLEECLV